MVHPAIQRALDGENVSAADIREFGGFEEFEKAFAEAQEAAIPKPVKCDWDDYTPRKLPADSWGWPDDDERKRKGERALFGGQIIFVVIVIPLLIMFACGG